MESYSCLHLPCAKRYYLTHPWIFIRDSYRAIRDMFHRAKYGWCYSDAWDFDNWFMNVAPQMLRHMAEHGCSYPGREPFTTREKWVDFLNEVADLIESGTEEWRDQHNEYYEEYMEHLMDQWEPAIKDPDTGFYVHKARERTELDEKYFARVKELMGESDNKIRIAFSLLSEHFFDLWD